jgi:hypothetical protein
VRTAVNHKPTLRAVLVGAYLFSVPAFNGLESSLLSNIPQFLGALLISYALYDIICSLRLEIPLEIGLYGLFGAWAALTFFTASRFVGSEPDSGGAWTAPIVSLLKVVLATLACSQLIKDEDDFFTALKIFVFSIFVVFYMNRHELQYLRITDKFTDADRFAGTLLNANVAAEYSLLMIWVSLLLFLRSGRKTISGILLLSPVGISLLIIYYSGSKKGMIGFCLFVIFITRVIYQQLGQSVHKRTLAILISAALIILTSYYIQISPFFNRIELLYTGKSDADTNRVMLIQDAIRVWLTSGRTFFVGVGYNNFCPAVICSFDTIRALGQHGNRRLLPVYVLFLLIVSEIPASLQEGERDGNQEHLFCDDYPTVLVFDINVGRSYVRFSISAPGLWNCCSICAKTIHHDEAEPDSRIVRFVSMKRILVVFWASRSSGFCPSSRRVTSKLRE